MASLNFDNDYSPANYNANFSSMLLGSSPKERVLAILDPKSIEDAASCAIVMDRREETQDGSPVQRDSYFFPKAVKTEFNRRFKEARKHYLEIPQKERLEFLGDLALNFLPKTGLVDQARDSCLVEIIGFSCSLPNAVRDRLRPRFEAVALKHLRAGERIPNSFDGFIRPEMYLSNEWQRQVRKQVIRQFREGSNFDRSCLPYQAIQKALESPTVKRLACKHIGTAVADFSEPRHIRNMANSLDIPDYLRTDLFADIIEREIKLALQCNRDSKQKAQDPIFFETPNLYKVVQLATMLPWANEDGSGIPDRTVSFLDHIRPKAEKALLYVLNHKGKEIGQTFSACKSLPHVVSLFASAEFQTSKAYQEGLSRYIAAMPPHYEWMIREFMLWVNESSTAEVAQAVRSDPKVRSKAKSIIIKEIKALIEVDTYRSDLPGKEKQYREIVEGSRLKIARTVSAFYPTRSSQGPLPGFKIFKTEGFKDHIGFLPGLVESEVYLQAERSRNLQLVTEILRKEGPLSGQLIKPLRAFSADVEVIGHDQNSQAEQLAKLLERHYQETHDVDDAGDDIWGPVVGQLARSYVGDQLLQEINLVPCQLLFIAGYDLERQAQVLDEAEDKQPKKTISEVDLALQERSEAFYQHRKQYFLHCRWGDSESALQVLNELDAIVDQAGEHPKGLRTEVLQLRETEAVKAGDLEALRVTITAHAELDLELGNNVTLHDKEWLRHRLLAAGTLQLFPWSFVQMQGHRISPKPIGIREASEPDLLKAHFLLAEAMKVGEEIDEAVLALAGQGTEDINYTPHENEPWDVRFRLALTKLKLFDKDEDQLFTDTLDRLKTIFNAVVPIGAEDDFDNGREVMFIRPSLLGSLLGAAEEYSIYGEEIACASIYETALEIQNKEVSKLRESEKWKEYPTLIEPSVLALVDITLRYGNWLSERGISQRAVEVLRIGWEAVSVFEISDPQVFAIIREAYSSAYQDLYGKRPKFDEDL